MGTDRHYKPGSFYRICDQTGFAQRAGRTRMQWNNLLVWERVYELRQPQDFVKGVRDDQSVPLPRPRQPNTFVEMDTDGAQFMVYGDSPLGPQFLVMNASSNIGYNAGINEASDYLNPDGTAQFQVFNGTVPPVNPSDFPSNVT